MKPLKNSACTHAALACLAACLIPCSLGAADSEKRIVPKCSTQLDPKNNKLILMVCDFSGISVAEEIIDAKAQVAVADDSGNILGSQVLQFADEKHRLRGGRKYSRRFELGVQKLPTSGVTVRISSAEAVAVPSVNAISH